MHTHKNGDPLHRSSGRKTRPPPQPLDLPEIFQVVIECRDEADQRELYERLTAEGRRCRLLVM